MVTTALVWFLWIALSVLIVLVLVELFATATAIKVIKHVETIEDEYRSHSRVTYRYPEPNQVKLQESPTIHPQED